jgi:hypothetical protein
VDWPAAAFWRELAGTFPLARIILTVRDSASWYASFRATIVERSTGLAPPRNSPLRAIYDLTQELILDGVFAGWEPLCEFLDRPIPGVPFPHLNTRASFLRDDFGSGSRRHITRS